MAGKKIFSIEGRHAYYGQVFSDLGDVVTDFNDFVNNPWDYKLVLFTGGEDVNPAFYGQKHYMNSKHIPYGRDTTELVSFQIAKRFDIPMAGICRGLQFTSCMLGASLIQDFPGHPDFHSTPILAKLPPGFVPEKDDLEFVEMEDDKYLIEGACYHHQIVDINTLQPGMEIVGTSYNTSANRRKKFAYYSDGGITVPQEQEIEAIYCANPRVFGVQYHPEGMNKNSSGRIFFMKWVEYMMSQKTNIPQADKAEKDLNSILKSTT